MNCLRHADDDVAAASGLPTETEADKIEYDRMFYGMEETGIAVDEQADGGEMFIGDRKK